MFGKRIGKRIAIAGVLIAVLSLPGCKQEVTTTVNQAIDDIQTTEAADDNTIQMDDVILKVGEESISYNEVLFYIYQAVNQYQSGLDDDVWDVKMDDGVTFNNFAKEGIIKELTELKIIGQQAEKSGVELTEDEMIDVRQQAKAFLSSVSEEDINEYGFDEKLLVDIYADHALANKMFDVTTGKVDTSISDEEVTQYSVQYLKVSTVNKNEDGTETEMTAKQKKAALKEAKTLYKSAKETDDFYTFAKSNTDADEVSLTFGKDDKPEEFGEEAMQLKTGELSEIIKGDSGYYIVYCVSDNDEDAAMEKKEQIIKERQNTVFEESYTTWSESYKVVVSTNLWKGLTMKGFK